MKETKPTIFVGVDVAKGHLDIFRSNGRKVVRIENTTAQIQAWIGRQKGNTIHVVMEATGGYETNFVDCLHESEIPCSAVNAKRIKDFARSCGTLEKTDAIDAKVIARFGEVMTPQPMEKPTKAVRLLKTLTARRTQILQQIWQEANRLEQSHCDVARSFMSNAVDFYKKQLKEVDLLISKAIEEDESCLRQSKILNSIPGVGKVMTATAVAQLPELGLLNRGQIAKLVGVAPLANDSGQKTGTRKTYAGRSSVRRVLYMAALVATKHNSIIRTFYLSLLARGKNKKVALVACMRKLLTIMNCMIRNNEIWRTSPEETA